MDIPGYGQVEGHWDLRDGIHEYLGGVEFKGKRVLEIGTASGFVCFYMESKGAEVVAYDLSEEHAWDIVPFSKFDYEQFVSDHKAHIRELNNGYWLCHGAHNSKAKVVYGTVYGIPEEIGTVDIAVFSSVLLHVRDPFLALQNALRLTKETVVVTEPIWVRQSFLRRILTNFTKPYMTFMPQFSKCEPKDGWWILTPDIIKEFIGVLGFEEAQVKTHFQKCNLFGVRSIPFFTVVGHRTKEI
jgi:hypothetical protein